MIDYFYLNTSSAHYLAKLAEKAAFGKIAYLIAAQLFIKNQ